MTVPPPLFVLGHWRSGTTHLHYLLGLDDRFAFPNFYQVIYPHTFLTTEQRFSGLTAFFLPEHRAYDNVRLDLKVPCEDEFAMCVSGFITHYLTGVFPRRAEHYERFLTLQNASPQEIEQWMSSLHMLVKKLTLKYDKPLILKSPAHTGRIKFLLDMFPDARFVHIHRDPYTVFQSLVHTYATGLPFGRLQDTRCVDWTERVIRQYKEIYDVFFAERGADPRLSLPRDQFRGVGEGSRGRDAEALRSPRLAGVRNRRADPADVPRLRFGLPEERVPRARAGCPAANRRRVAKVL